MQTVKLNFSKNKATIILENKVISFEISLQEVTKLKDFVLKYNFNGSEFYLKRIKAIVEKNFLKITRIKDYSVRLKKNKLKEEILELETNAVNLDYFRTSAYFTVDNKNVYLKDTKFILPDSYLELILKHKANSIEPYINFMYNLSSNPNESVRDKVWGWVEDKGFKITENGYIFGARWVVSRNPELDADFSKYVNSQYIKLKLQKKSPKNYIVYSDKTNTSYFLKEYSKVVSFVSFDIFAKGNLETLYFDNKLQFTDQYTKTLDIQLGTPVVIDRSRCDDSDAQCSRGLHFASLKDVQDLNFGDQLITVLVNPKNLVSLPQDSYRKARCCEYFPYSLIKVEDVKEMLDDSLVINDVDYESINLDIVLTSLKEKTKLYKTNGDKIKAIKDKIDSLTVDSRQKLEIVDFNRIVKL